MACRDHTQPARQLRANEKIYRGFSLLELILSISILSVLLGLGIPAFQHLLTDTQEQALVANYLHAFNTARYTAVATQRHISLCEMDAENRCTGRWGSRLALFYDADRDGTAKTPSDIIEWLELPAAETTQITFRAFRRTNFITLRANGHYRQNGTFRFCTPGNQTGRAIVINVSGRARTERIACG